MRSGRTAGIPVLAGVLALFLVGAASADSGFVAPLTEIPLTNQLPAGARAAGMGFVSMAIADDATCITTNPAALARLNRVELSGGFRRSSFGIEGGMAGSDFATELSGTDFTSVRFAYPFPTFRGSLVFGLGAERLYDFDADRLAAYQDEISWQENPGEPDETGVWSSEEDYVAEGGITSLSAACAVDVSPAISLGAAVSYLTGDYNSTFMWDVYDDLDVSERYTDVHIIEQYDSNVSGIRATLGGLFYVSEQLSVGVAIDTPTSLTFDGTEVSYIRQVTTNPDSTTAYEVRTLFTDEVTLPFSFRGGCAYSPVDFVVVGADVSFTEWSDMEYAGRLTETESGTDGLSRRSLYEGTFGFGIGAEVTVPSWPLRVRGGYVSRPHAFKGLEVDTDRSYLTLGAGVLIDTVLAVDIAWLHGTYERSDEDFAYSETVDDDALIVEATYRF